MTYTEPQRIWLEQVSGTVVAKSVEAAKMFQAKEDGQKLIAGKLGPQKEMIGAAFAGVNLKLKSEGLEGAFRELIGRPAEMRLVDKDHDPMKEVDTWHDAPNLQAIDPLVIKTLMENYKKILETADELRKNDYYKEPEKPPVPVEPSTPAQRKEYKELEAAYKGALKEARRRLAEDLYKPLEREGVLPENFIPDEYSEVTRQFEEANVFYEQRLQDYSRELGEYGAFLEKFGDGMAIAKGLLGVAASGAGLAGSIGTLVADGEVVKNAKEAKEIMEWVAVGMTSFEGVVEGTLKERDGIAVADALNATLSKVLATVLPGPAAAIVNGAIEAAIRSCSAGKKFAENDIEGGLDELAKAISGGIGAADTSKDKKATAIGDGIALGLKALARSSSVAKLIKEKNYREALSVIIQNVDTVVEPAKGPAMDWAKDIDEKTKELGKDISDIAAVTQVINGQIDQKALAAQREKAAEMQRENFEEFMRQQDRGLEEALAFGFAEPTDDVDAQEQAEAKRLESLERIVAIYKRNEMMFELSKKILVGGPQFIAKLVPGLGLVAAATQLAFSIAEALKCAQQMLIWSDNMQDARKASTAQLDAILNRYGLQAKQTIIANIKVATAALKVAGEAMKLAGQAAPVGAVLSASADTAESLMEVSAKVVEVAQMRSAWKDYKYALANPQDRKGIRQAMRSNPTLSKYAMAWGAVEDGNPIAKEVMRRCNLNERTLAQSDLNVGAVVDYLEMIYKDDPVLLRSIPNDANWHPSGGVEFSMTSWLRFYQAAGKDAEPPLEDFDISAINAAMSGYEQGMEALQKAIKVAIDRNIEIARANAEADKQARIEFRKARDEFEALSDNEKEGKVAPEFEEVEPVPYDSPEPAVCAAALKAATNAMAAFSRVKPVTKETGDPHASFASYTDAMSARARMARDEIDGLWEAEDWLP